jgi:acyl-CoA dehydrogenase
MAREPRDTLGFEEVKVVASAPHPLGPDAVEKYGAMLRAAQMAGALEYLLAQSVAYANERPQFGRPIGKFQAIQQQLAGLACETAAARTAAENAFRVAGLGGNADPGFEIAAAKVRAGEAATAGPSIAHQVHGAIGFTYEHNLHFATRRLWSWRAEYGTAQRWARVLGRQALERGGENLWADVTARP